MGTDVIRDLVDDDIGDPLRPAEDLSVVSGLRSENSYKRRVF